MTHTAHNKQPTRAAAIGKWQRDALDALDAKDALEAHTKRQEKTATWEGRTYRINDYVRFKHEGDTLTGWIADFRKDVRNGSACAWIELDGALPGSFLAPPLSDLE